MAFIQGQRLFEGGVYLKIGHNGIFSFNLTVYFLSVGEFLQQLTEACFDCHHSYLGVFFNNNCFTKNFGRELNR